MKKTLSFILLTLIISSSLFAQHNLAQEQLLAHADGIEIGGNLRCPDLAKPPRGSHNIPILRAAAGIVAGKCKPEILRPYLNGDWGGLGAHDAASEIYGPWHYTSMLAVYRHLDEGTEIRTEIRRYLRAWLAFHALGTVDTIPRELVILGPDGYRDVRQTKPVHDGLWYSAPASRSATVETKPPGQVEIASAHRILSAALLGRWQSTRKTKHDFAPRLLEKLGVLRAAGDPESWAITEGERATLLHHVRTPTPSSSRKLLSWLEGYRPPMDATHTWMFFSNGVLAFSERAYHQPKDGQGFWLISAAIDGRAYRGTAAHPKERRPGFVMNRGRELVMQTLKEGRIDVDSLDLSPFGFASHLVVWDSKGWRIEQPERPDDAGGTKEEEPNKDQVKLGPVQIELEPSEAWAIEREALSLLPPERFHSWLRFMIANPWFVKSLDVECTAESGHFVVVLARWQEPVLKRWWTRDSLPRPIMMETVRVDFDGEGIERCLGLREIAEERVERLKVVGMMKAVRLRVVGKDLGVASARLDEAGEIGRGRRGGEEYNVGVSWVPLGSMLSVRRE